jgi:hypothetical protein
VTFTTGEIVGHRYWIVAWDGNLFGPHSGRHWHTYVPMSGKVARDTHGGVYALKTRELIDQFLANKEALKELSKMWRPPLLARALAVGTVALWGTVWEHEAGFRAQYGRVRTIDELFDGQEFERRRVFSGDLAILRTKYRCVALSDSVR